MLAVVGAKTSLSIKHIIYYLIGTYFLTTESDKCMHLLTRLYGITGARAFIASRALCLRVEGTVYVLI